ncbi:uncharacterized protein [Fopius arisanus]|uniref:Uncharacterized protein n=1 Tax=Fopius arisanus TaxID=64838 RepID=A0A9R1SXY6_9HYME|nr:PREDICTED: uncharacterized protein LOC105264312 [Fopius arisanus]
MIFKLIIVAIAIIGIAESRLCICDGLNFRGGKCSSDPFCLFGDDKYPTSSSTLKQLFRLLGLQDPSHSLTPSLRAKYIQLLKYLNPASGFSSLNPYSSNMYNAVLTRLFPDGYSWVDVDHLGVITPLPFDLDMLPADGSCSPGRRYRKGSEICLCNDGSTPFCF